MVARLLELPEGIVAKADVVRRDVVRADVHRRDVVELERLLIVPDAVVEAADLEGDVLGSVQREVVGPDARQVSAQIIPQFLAAGRHLVQNHVPELVKHVRVPVAQLEQRHDGFQGRGLRVLLERLLQDEEIVRPESNDGVLEDMSQMRKLQRSLRRRIFASLCPRHGRRRARLHRRVRRRRGRIARFVAQQHEDGDLERGLLLRVVQREAAARGAVQAQRVVVDHDGERPVHRNVRVQLAPELLRVVVALIAGDDHGAAARQRHQVAHRSHGADGHQHRCAAGALPEKLRVPAQDAPKVRRVLVVLGVVVTFVDGSIRERVVQPRDDGRVERVGLRGGARSDGDEALHEATLVDLEDVVAERVEEVVRNDANRVGARVLREDLPAVVERDGLVVDGVEDGEVELAVVDVFF
mmetsp:Transcript_8497/g.27983  ORF Transcript_8497/g.27983 Transcript_8497/m.27983 type:complete len:412 (+) Transcript_8497:117-1352(+)